MKVEAMLWMLILISLALAIVSRTYRRYGLIVLGLGVVTLIAVVALVSRNDAPTSSPPAPARQMARVDFEQAHVDKLDLQDPQAKQRIALGEIRFDQVRPSAVPDPAAFESVLARLYNDSAHYTLTDYAYYLVIQDCVAQACTTVYDQHGLASTQVPPHQARDVVIEIRELETRESPHFKLLGTPKIILTVTATRAYQAAQSAY